MVVLHSCELNNITEWSYFHSRELYNTTELTHEMSDVRTNFRGHKLTQNKAQKKNKKKYPEKVPPNTCDKNMIHVEGTTYNHGRPEGISEDQHPMNQFLGMLRAGPPIRTQIYGIIPRGSSLPTSPDPAP